MENANMNGNYMNTIAVNDQLRTVLAGFGKLNNVKPKAATPFLAGALAVLITGCGLILAVSAPEGENNLVGN
jgi:hypothetical protein